MTWGTASQPMAGRAASNTKNQRPAASRALPKFHGRIRRGNSQKDGSRHQVRSTARDSIDWIIIELVMTPFSARIDSPRISRSAPRYLQGLETLLFHRAICDLMRRGCCVATCTPLPRDNVSHQLQISSVMSLLLVRSKWMAAAILEWLSGSPVILPYRQTLSSLTSTDEMSLICGVSNQVGAGDGSLPALPACAVLGGKDTALLASPPRSKGAIHLWPLHYTRWSSLPLRRRNKLNGSYARWPTSLSRIPAMCGFHGEHHDARRDPDRV